MSKGSKPRAKPSKNSLAVYADLLLSPGDVSPKVRQRCLRVRNDTYWKALRELEAADLVTIRTRPRSTILKVNLSFQARFNEPSSEPISVTKGETYAAFEHVLPHLWKVWSWIDASALSPILQEAVNLEHGRAAGIQRVIGAIWSLLGRQKRGEHIKSPVGLLRHIVREGGKEPAPRDVAGIHPRQDAAVSQAAARDEEKKRVELNRRELVKTKAETIAEDYEKMTAFLDNAKALKILKERYAEAPALDRALELIKRV